MSAPAPTARGGKPALSFLGPPWFASVMGLCGLALAWHRAVPGQRQAAQAHHAGEPGRAEEAQRWLAATGGGCGRGHQFLPPGGRTGALASQVCAVGRMSSS